MRRLIAGGVVIVSLVAFFAIPGAQAMTIPAPAGIAALVDQISPVEEVAMVCRRVRQCGPYGCGWRRQWPDGSYTLAGVAEVIGVHMRTVHTWMARGMMVPSQTYQGGPIKITLSAEQIESLQAYVARVRRPRSGCRRDAPGRGASRPCARGARDGVGARPAGASPAPRAGRGTGRASPGGRRLPLGRRRFRACERGAGHSGPAPLVGGGTGWGEIPNFRGPSPPPLAPLSCRRHAFGMMGEG